MNPFDRLALAALATYQRHLSPRKGYCCAHRVVHGGLSCSAFARQAITRDGLWPALAAIHNRLRACRAAARHLTTRRDRDEKRKKRGCEAMPDCLPDACPDSCDGGSCLPDACVRPGVRTNRAATVGNQRRTTSFNDRLNSTRGRSGSTVTDLRSNRASKCLKLF